MTRYFSVLVGLALLVGTAGVVEATVVYTGPQITSQSGDAYITTGGTLVASASRSAVGSESAHIEALWTANVAQPHGLESYQFSIYNDFSLTVNCLAPSGLQTDGYAAANMYVAVGDGGQVLFDQFGHGLFIEVHEGPRSGIHWHETWYDYWWGNQTGSRSEHGTGSSHADYDSFPLFNNQGSGGSSWEGTMSIEDAIAGIAVTARVSSNSNVTDPSGNVEARAEGYVSLWMYPY